MIKLIEWCLDFRVAPARPGGSPVTDKDAEMLMDAAVDWAVSRDYGVGGGYKTGSDGSGSLDFRFGLTATLDDQLISDEEAQQLVDHLRELAKRSGWTMTRGYREFNEEDQARFEAAVRTEDDDDDDDDFDEEDEESN